MNERAPVKRFAPFACEKKPATGSRAMVVANHPLASAAGAEMLLAGGNAVDAAVAALFALTVVEPMMVGVLGGGIAHIRLANGRHVVLDGLGTAPGAAHGAMYETVSDALPRYRETAGRANQVGPLAVAVPGALAGWCRALRDFGTLSTEDVTAPAVRLAERGFTATPYLADCVADLASDLGHDPGLSALFLPGGTPLRAGARVVQPEYAQTLRTIAREGADALYAGELGSALVEAMSRTGGLVTREDLGAYRVIERDPIRGAYRGFEILGPPPPASSGVHVVQMLNLLEGFDVGAMGFGSPDAVHLLAEVMKIAFADRAVATADPAFIEVPVERLTGKGYAEQRRRLIDPARTRRWEPGVPAAAAKSGAARQAARDAPGGSGAPGGPEVPGRLEAPGGSGAPGRLEAPGGSEALDGSGVPGRLEAPGGSGVPGRLEAPGGSGAPGRLEAPGGFGAPGGSEALDGSGVPDGPGAEVGTALGREPGCTTHVTVADAEGNVVATTQTINGLFGACIRIPGTGMIANNYMFNFDPHPGRALSVEPGKRVFTSMAPMMVRREGQLLYALGLPGGLRIFPSALQALVNLLDHGMTLQEAVEAPRIWTEGGAVEMEEAFPEAVGKALADRGHEVERLPRIGGGMNAIAFADDGGLTGAACWRADGTPVAIAGGLARAGVRFSGM